jgi:hypothetical protein
VTVKELDYVNIEWMGTEIPKEFKRLEMNVGKSLRLKPKKKKLFLKI